MEKNSTVVTRYDQKQQEMAQVVATAEALMHRDTAIATELEPNAVTKEQVGHGNGFFFCACKCRDYDI